MEINTKHIAKVAPVLLSFSCLAITYFLFFSVTLSYAAPSLQVKSASSTLKKSISCASFTVTSNQSGTYNLVVSDSKGRFVQNLSKKIAKNTVTTLSWNGRVASNNELKKASNDYVASGIYCVELSVKGDQGTVRATRKITVSANGAPRITLVQASSSLTPSPQKGAHAYKVSYTISKKNDVTFQVYSASTKKMIAQKKYRDVSANNLHALYWDGQITVSGSTKLPSGELARSGDVAPAGTYTIYVKSQSKNKSKTISVKPTPVSSLSVSVPHTAVTYGTKQTLKASVAPRGASSAKVSWSSSNTSLAKVSSSGEMTAQSGKEGTVKITAKSVASPSITKTVSVKIVSTSTLKSTGVAVTKWCQYKASKTLLGTVTSNTPITWVKLSILDASGNTEISKLVSAGDPRYCSASRTFDMKSSMDAYIPFGKLSPGKKSLVLEASDSVVTRKVYAQTFWVIGPTNYQAFWTDRKDAWVYPLNIYNARNTSAFGTYRDSGARAHAAIDLIEPAGTKVYAMTDGVVERISVGTYYQGTGAVQVKNSDGSVIWYCEVKAVSGLKVGSAVKQNQHIATIQRNNSGTAMLHLEAYSGKATGSLYSSTNTTYDNVTAVRYCRRRDLIYPMGVLDLKVPETRTIK